MIIIAPFLGVFKHRKEKFYVVEIDGERPHEAEFLAEWLKPEVTIWVSIGLSHAVQFEKEVENGNYENGYEWGFQIAEGSALATYVDSLKSIVSSG